MPLSLKLHSDSLCDAVSGIEVEVVQPQTNRLVLSYMVSGSVGDIRLPDAATPERSDGLWQNTCFEAFIRPATGAGYYEFNFAPSTRWAAYRFVGYRSGMLAAAEIAAPAITTQASDGTYELRATLHWDQLSGLMSGAEWRLGLSAVIEETNGRKSYWALTHPAGEPDFHHADCFALDLSQALKP